jgi:hypothetical protein
MGGSGKIQPAHSPHRHGRFRSAMLGHAATTFPPHPVTPNGHPADASPTRCTGRVPSGSDSLEVQPLQISEPSQRWRERRRALWTHDVVAAKSGRWAGRGGGGGQCWEEGWRAGAVLVVCGEDNYMCAHLTRSCQPWRSPSPNWEIECLTSGSYLTSRQAFGQSSTIWPNRNLAAPGKARALRADRTTWHPHPHQHTGQQRLGPVASRLQRARLAHGAVPGRACSTRGSLHIHPRARTREGLSPGRAWQGPPSQPSTWCFTRTGRRPV